MLVCMKNTALGCVSQELYSTQLCLVLYESLDTPPCAVFSIYMHGGALTVVYRINTLQEIIEYWIKSKS